MSVRRGGGAQHPLRPIGLAVRFFLTRHWSRTRIGPYVVTTAEVRRSAYETTVTWGEGGPQVKSLGAALSLNEVRARAEHERLCARAERELGRTREPVPRPPAA